MCMYFKNFQYNKKQSLMCIQYYICSSKFSPDDKLKFLLRCRPHGFKPNGLSHSYTATATAVIFNDVKMAIQSSGENGNKNASNGISDLVFGDANKETPL